MLNNLIFIKYKSQRCSYTYKLHMLSLELFAQDRCSFLPGESERLLSQNVESYEVCLFLFVLIGYFYYFLY